MEAELILILHEIPEKLHFLRQIPMIYSILGKLLLFVSLLLLQPPQFYYKFIESCAELSFAAFPKCPAKSSRPAATGILFQFKSQNLDNFHTLSLHLP